MANNTNNTQEKKDQAVKEEVKKNNPWSEETNKAIREELKKQKQK